MDGWLKRHLARLDVSRATTIVMETSCSTLWGKDSLPHPGPASHERVAGVGRSPIAGGKAAPVPEADERRTWLRGFRGAARVSHAE